MNTETPLEIGKARIEEIPEVVDLCMAVEEQHEAYWPLRWQRRAGIKEGYLGWLKRRLDEPRTLILVARDSAAGKVAGMLLAGIEKEIPIYVHTEYAFIHDLAVLDAYRRRGVAQDLLKQAAQWARGQGVNQLRLMVAHQNPSARAAFAKAGFRATYEEMVLGLHAAESV